MYLVRGRRSHTHTHACTHTHTHAHTHTHTYRRCEPLKAPHHLSNNLLAQSGSCITQQLHLHTNTHTHTHTQHTHTINRPHTHTVDAHALHTHTHTHSHTHTRKSTLSRSDIFPATQQLHFQHPQRTTKEKNIQTQKTIFKAFNVRLSQDYAPLFNLMSDGCTIVCFKLTLSNYGTLYSGLIVNNSHALIRSRFGV